MVKAHGPLRPDPNQLANLKLAIRPRNEAIFGLVNKGRAPHPKKGSDNKDTNRIIMGKELLTPPDHEMVSAVF